MQIIGPTQPPGFSPALLTLHVNDTVVFINQSSPPAPFSVTSDDGSFTSPVIATGNQWTTTFNAIGTHEYHEASNPHRMVGEVMIVANSVALLPTPIPEAEATVLAAIEAGRSPPNTIVIPTPATIAAKSGSNKTSTSASPLPWILVILAILVVIGFGIWFYRRMRKRAREREEAEDFVLDDVASTRPLPRQAEPPAQPKIGPLAQVKQVRKFAIAGFLRRRKHEDDDDMDSETEDDDA